MPKMIDPNDIVGREFGKLKVKAYLGLELRGIKTIDCIYDCDCSCGKIRRRADALTKAPAMPYWKT